MNLINYIISIFQNPANLYPILVNIGLSMSVISGNSLPYVCGFLENSLILYSKL